MGEAKQSTEDLLGSAVDRIQFPQANVQEESSEVLVLSPFFLAADQVSRGRVRLNEKVIYIYTYIYKRLSTDTLYESRFSFDLCIGFTLLLLLLLFFSE